jgi:hypothetical protein
MSSETASWSTEELEKYFTDRDKAEARQRAEARGEPPPEKRTEELAVDDLEA